MPNDDIGESKNNWANTFHDRQLQYLLDYTTTAATKW